MGNERTIKRKMEAENLNKVCVLIKPKNKEPYLVEVRVLDEVGQGM